MELRGKRALVMGLGVHGGGLGVARFLASQGADVTVTDLREPELLRSSLDALAGLPIHFVLGKHRDADFQNAEIVVRNPGVPRESRYLQIARAAGAQIEMEMTLFFRLCQGPIIGITGTKGKTTTTLLTGAMIKQAHPDAVIAGNLRVSALEQLPIIGPQTPVILELSSFVLEGLGEAGLSPSFAGITNLSADHLDRYGSMESYADAKAQIFLHQHAGDLLALNASDPILTKIASRAPGRIAWFDTICGPPISPMARLTAWDNERLISRFGNTETMICETADLQLPGAHNRANLAAAATLALEFGVAAEQIRAAIRAFTGVPYRLEPVRELDGVRYINDTAATAPEAAIAALHSFNQPIVLIAGGADKNLPFEAFGKAIVERTKAVVLLAGSATEKLQQAIQNAGTSAIELAGPISSFEEAIATARNLAQPGDIILLSPGCASFGMFRNEFHRGDEFLRIVHALG